MSNDHMAMGEVVCVEPTGLTERSLKEESMPLLTASVDRKSVV